MGPANQGEALSALRTGAVAAAVWSALAFASMQLRDGADSVLLIWLPSAVSVAALYVVPKRSWPLTLALLGASQFATLWLYGARAQILGVVGSNIIEATVSAAIGLWILGDRGNVATTYRHIAGLFGAAIAGAALGALAAFPFRGPVSLADLAWWFLASVLGILGATPVLLYLRQRLGLGDHHGRFRQADGKRGFALTVAALFALGAVVFVSPASVLLPVLLPVLVVAIVFAVIRYGQLAAAFGVMAYAVAGTMASTGGRSPIPALDMAPLEASLILQALMLLMLATALPIAAVLLNRDRLEARLREQNAALHDSLTILGLAESLARIGRWRYDLVSGRQEWSPLMLDLNGLPRELAPDPGDVRELLPDSGERLFGEIAAHRDDAEPYSFEYRVVPATGDERVLKIHVSNEFDESGRRVAIFAVAMDVTEQVRREQALEDARKRAISLAAEAQKLANTDPLTGLANRRATLGWLGSLTSASEENADPLALLMFDIDHFKQINDCFGHQTGDEVLKRVASIARAHMRTEDLVGRIGGEEFVCILSGLGDVETRRLAERLCLAIAQGSAAEGLPTVTISVGLAQFRNGDTPATLLARADAALYEAKDAGRNQVRRAA